MKRTAPYIILALMCLGLFFWQLGSVPLMGFDEGIYAECSREMMASGNYLVPAANGQPFFDKPPLAYWLQVAGMKIFGVNSFAVRLPSAIAAALLVLLIVCLGTKLFGRCAGLYAGFILPTGMLATGLARMCLLDQLFALTINAAFAAFVLAYLRIWRRWGYMAFWAAVGLSVMVKGPAGAVLIIAAIMAFLALRKNIGEIKRMMPISGLLLLLLIASPWYILVQKATNGAFLREFIFHQNLQRAMGKDFSHNMPFYFYLPIYLMGFFPWSVFMPLAWKQHIRLRPSDKQGEAALFLGVTILAIVGIFSISVSKLPSYIYPVLPASALLVGLMWSRAAEQIKFVSLKRYAICALILTAIIAAGMLYAQITQLHKTIPGLSAALILMNVSMLTGIAVSILMICLGRSRTAFGTICAGAAGFLGAAVILGLPATSRTLWEPTVQMGQVVSKLVPQDAHIFAYRLRPAQPGLGFYAQRPVMSVKTREELLSQFAENGPNFVVTQKNELGNIPEGGRIIKRIEPYSLYKYSSGVAIR